MVNVSRTSNRARFSPQTELVVFLVHSLCLGLNPQNRSDTSLPPPPHTDLPSSQRSLLQILIWGLSFAKSHYFTPLLFPTARCTCLKAKRRTPALTPSVVHPLPAGSLVCRRRWLLLRRYSVLSAPQPLPGGNRSRPSPPHRGSAGTAPSPRAHRVCSSVRASVRSHRWGRGALAGSTCYVPGASTPPTLLRE